MWRDVATLSEADLAAHRVWEWRSVGLLEQARPTDLTFVPEATAASPTYIAATEFVTANGQRLLGYCSPADLSGLDYTQPVILASNGPVPLWNESIGAPDPARVASALGRTISEVFPLRVRCMVPSAEGLYVVSVDGT